MLNTGTWGISIMELDKVVDAGKILVTKEFQYQPAVVLVAGLICLEESKFWAPPLHCFLDPLIREYSHVFFSFLF